MKKRKIFNIFSVWEKIIFLILGIANISLLLFYYKGTDTYFSHQGIKAFKKKQGEKAEKFFNQALKKKPFDPWTYLNLSLNDDFLLRQPDKAIEKYKEVSSHLNKYSDKALFYSYFNQAELFARTGSLEKALENYQKALEFLYKEKEIKKNIELLFQKNEEKEEQNSQKKENKNQDSKAQQEEREKQNSESQPEESKEQESEKQQQERKEQEKQQEEKEEQESESQPEEREEQESGEQDPENQQEQSPTAQQENYEEQDFRNKNSKEDFNNAEERAILKEIEENDAKTRKKFYQRKEIFGDKTQKDW